MDNKNKMLIISILCGIIGFSCVSKDSNKSISVTQSETVDSIVVNNKDYYSKIDSFVNLYDYDEFLSLKPYPIEDSLCFYMKKLNRKELFNDDDFKYIAGKFLERQYLQARKRIPNPEIFPVYNTSILYGNGRRSNGFALKIVLQEDFRIDSIFDLYAHPWREFLCIDSVIVTLDKIPQIQNDPNHLKCMNLVKNNKTGGCKW